MVGLLQDQMESDGYICIPASLVWGALGYLGIRWGNRFAIIVFKMLPLFLMKILVLVLLGVLVVDILGSYLLLRGKGKNLARWEATNEGPDKVSNKLGSAISGWVGKRIQKSVSKGNGTDPQGRGIGEGKSICRRLWVL